MPLNPPSQLTLEELRRRVEEVQLGKTRSPDIAKNRETTPQSGEPEGLAARRALAERVSSSQSFESSQSTLPTDSTDSAKTVRAESIASPAPILTPSYPFPRVPLRLARGQSQRSALSHKPFTLLSPTSAPPKNGEASDTTPGGLAESDISTPAQAPRFAPSRMPSASDEGIFTTPNMYDIVLALSSEPGIDPWWSNVIQILQDFYYAERASLAVPGDMTDLENVPWGQKASFNVMGTNHESHSGLDASFHGSEASGPGKEGSHSASARKFDSALSVVREEGRSVPATRPSLENRHSFAGHLSPERPKAPTRAISTFANTETRSSHVSAPSRQAGDENHSQVHESPPKDGNVVAVADSDSQMPLAVIYRVLQPLESEKDPLLVRTGVAELFGRTKPVVLTREYTATEPASGSSQDLLEQSTKDAMIKEGQKRVESNEVTTMYSNRKAGGLGAELQNFSHRQLLSRAPCPSYEEYEQPEPSPWSQSPAPSPAARPDPTESPFFVSSGKIDESAFQQNPPMYDYSQGGPLEAIGADNSKTLIHIPLVQHVSRHSKSISPVRFPTAILSIITPVTPYPTSLRRSLRDLLPHLASTFLLASQYSNLEARLAGVPTAQYGTGYGLGGTFSDESSELELVAELSGQIAQGAVSAHGSLHSPTGSTASRESPAGSRGGTPALESAALFGLSPNPITPGRSGSEMIDSYFSSKRGQDSRTQGRSADRAGIRGTNAEESPVATRGKRTKSGTGATSKLNKRATSSQPEERATEENERQSTTSTDPPEQTRHMSTSTLLTQRARDMASKPLPEMISQLMLNSVPLQLFLAKPNTGELLWTNTRFQAFRSQNPSQRVRDPWQNVHPEDLSALEQGWNSVLKSGSQFTMHIRVKRFNNDNDYRWFIFRASTLLSQTGSILYFIGSFMDVHEQHLAELKAAEEKETSARDAKYRALANSIPQILFEAVENQGIVSTNDQWQVFSGQPTEESLHLGFARHVHRDDLLKCRIALPAISASDPASQTFSLSFTDLAPQDSATTRSGSSSSSSKTVQATRLGSGESPQRAKPPTLAQLVRDGIVSVHDDENGRPSYSLEIRLKSKGGEFRWFLVRLVKVDSPLINGGRASWYGTCTDINDRKNLERELNYALSKLNKEMESKTRFFANMSHEIRTPLNGILGSIPWLLESVLDVDQRRTLDTIQNSSNNLKELVDNILDVTKVEAGKMTLIHRWFHIRTLLEDTIDTISSRAIDRGLELNYTVDLEVPHTVKGDAFRLRQVLINLIGNAVKFTEQGEIYAHCSISKSARRSSDSVMLVFDVIDTGKGFTAPESQRLFKQFGQIEGSNSQHEAGTGLGLFLSKQLVEMHGGRLTATGKEGEGATFTFTVEVGLPTVNDQPTSPSVPKAKRKISGIPETLPASPGPGPSISSPSPTSFRPISSPSLGSPGPLSTTSSIPSLRSQTYLTDRSTPSSLVATPESNHSLQTSKLTAAMAPSERQKLAELAMASKPVVEGLPGQRTTAPLTPGSPHPTTFSIVIICPAKYARNAFKQHIEQVVPHEIAANVVTMAGTNEWLEMYNGPVPPVFTHVVVDLPETPGILNFMQEFAKMKPSLIPELVIITDHYQKREIMDQHKVMTDSGLKIYLVNKPVKPSVFALIFDPSQLRNLSKDRGRDISQAKTEDFKNVAQMVRETIGDRNFRILVVEDSDVNRMVRLYTFGKEKGLTLSAGNSEISPACEAPKRDCKEWSRVHPTRSFQGL